MKKFVWNNLKDGPPKGRDGDEFPECLVWADGHCITQAVYFPADGDTEAGFFVDACAPGGRTLERLDWPTHWINTDDIELPE